MLRFLLAFLLFISATPASAGRILLGFPFGCDAGGSLTLTAGDHLFEMVSGSPLTRSVETRHPGAPFGPLYHTADYIVHCRGGNVSAAQLSFASGEAAKQKLKFSNGTLYSVVTTPVADRVWAHEQVVGYDPLPPNAGNLLPSVSYLLGTGEAFRYPPGYLGGKSVQSIVADIDPATNLPGLRVNNSFGPIAAIDDSPALVSLLATVVKPLSELVAIILLLVAALVVVDIVFNRDANKQPLPLVAFLLVALFCVLVQAPQSIVSASDLENQRQVFMQDRVHLAQLMPTTDGVLEPIGAVNFKEVLDTARPRTLILTPYVSPLLWLDVLIAAAFVGFYALNVISASYFLFVRHPASAVVTPALRDAAALDRTAFLDAITPNPEEFERPPPIPASINQTAKAEALARKLDADADLARAAAERERARAALLDAEQELKAAKRRSKETR